MTPRAPLDQGFFGRRHGKTLRPKPAAALQAGLARYLLDISVAPPRDLTSLFASSVTDVRLEIGFGGGEHLLTQARANPGVGFIGVEPFVNGMAKAMSELAREPLHNLRVHDQDAVKLLDWLPAGSIEQVDLLYPDPWPKRKHWKRRFVSPVNLDRFARVLRPGGTFRFASDAAGYVNWTLIECGRHRAFDWLAASPADWRTPYPGWVTTRYEAKAVREGRRTAYLRFTKRQA